MKKITIILLLFSCVLGAQDKKYHLELNLKKGGKYFINSSGEQKMSFKAGIIVKNLEENRILYAEDSQSFNYLTDHNIITSFEVVDIKGDSIHFKAYFTRFSHDITIDDNSLEDTMNNINNLSNNLLNQPFELVVLKNGSTLSLDGLNEMIYKTISENKNSTSEEKEAAFEEIKSKTNDIESQFFTHFPDYAVSVNDSWKREHVIKQPPLEIIMTTIYTLKEVTKKHYIIEASTKISNPDNIKFDDFEETIVDFGGFIHSTIHIDRKSGWLISSKTKGDYISKLYLLNSHSDTYMSGVGYELSFKINATISDE